LTLLLVVVLLLLLFVAVDDAVGLFQFVFYKHKTSGRCTWDSPFEQLAFAAADNKSSTAHEEENEFMQTEDQTIGQQQQLLFARSDSTR